MARPILPGRPLPSPTVPGLGWLGVGYRPFGAIVDPTMQTWQLFDMPDQGTQVTYNNKTYWKHAIVEFAEQLTADANSTRVVNVNEMSREISARVGVSADLRLFSGELNAVFKSRGSAAWQYMYTLVDVFQHNLSLKLPPVDQMRQYLKPSVRSELDAARTQPAFRAFLDKYGTHYLGGIQVGGAYHLYLSFQKTSYSSTAQMDADAHASILFFKGQSGGSIETKLDSLVQEENIFVTCVGAVADPGDITSIKITAWSQQVTENPSWCGFLQSSGPYPMGLVPIYLLATSVSPFEKWWKYYVQEKGFIAPDIGPCVTDIRVSADKNENRARNAAAAGGYELLPMDLNKDAGGAYIYGAVKTETLSYDLGSALTGLVVIEGKDNVPPAGYTKIDVDLNKGCGKKTPYLYLCYERGVPSKAPIREVSVVAFDKRIDEASCLNKGWRVVKDAYADMPADVNKGAGGKFIYLLYRA